MAGGMAQVHPAPEVERRSTEGGHKGYLGIVSSVCI